jgi:hypothetical protein
MRTTKRNIIEIDPGEQLEIRCGSATLEIRGNPDLAAEPAAPEFEIVLPSGMMMSGLRQHRNREEDITVDAMGYGSFTFEDEEGLLEEVSGPLDFIIFSSLLRSTIKEGDAPPAAELQLEDRR